MNKTIRLLLICIGLTSLLQAQQDTEKQTILTKLDNRLKHYAGIAQEIWGHAELGFQEEQSTRLLQETLVEAGFDVQKGVAGMPTSFVATYGSGGAQ